MFYLADNPLPMRKLNLTMPDHAKSTLEEADDYLAQRLERRGYTRHAGRDARAGLSL